MMNYPQPSKDPELIARQRASAKRLAYVLAGIAVLIFVLGFVKVAFR